MPSRRTSKQRIQAIRSRPHKARKPRPSTRLARQPGEPKDTADHTQQDLTRTAQAQSSLVPYNPRLLNRSRLQLQLGDWERLADLDDHELQHNPAAAELQLLAAAGHLQKGGEQARARARALIDSAMEAGLNRESVARILIGGASNTLGRIAALSDRPDDKVMHHFRSAIAIALPDADTDLLLQPTATRQLVQLARASGSEALMDMAHRTALSLPADEPAQNPDRPASEQQEEDPPEPSKPSKLLSIPLDLTIDGHRHTTQLVPNHPEAFKLDGSELVYELPGNTPGYLVTNQAGDFESPVSFHNIQLKPNTAYELSGHVPVCGEQNPIFWFFEYANGKRSASASFPTKDGAFTAHIRTSANPESVNFGIRLGGKGRLLMSGPIVSINIASNKRTLPVQADGKKYVIVLPDWQIDYIQGVLANKAVPYELDMLQAMRDVLDADDLVLDVGANIGNHTLYLAMVVGCRVLAFEPNPQLTDPLQESIVANNLEARVTLIGKGVGAAQAKGAFLNLKPDNLGAQPLTLVDDADSSQDGALEVIPLDSVDFDQPVKAIKIDVEGMELDVLKGATKILEKHRPELFIESQDMEQFAAIHDHLEALGYVYWQTFNATPTNWFRPAEVAAQSDLQKHGLAQGKALYKLWEEKQSLRSQLKSSEKK